MKITKQDVGVWIKASDEKPAYGEEVPVSFDGKNFECMATFEERTQCMLSGNGGGYFYNKFQDVENKLVLSDVTHWLKPLEDVYVLTEEELEEFALEFTEHLTDAIVEAKPDSNLSSEEIYKQFLESIKSKS